MKKEDLIAKGLPEEQAKAVLELYNTEIKDYVPKADLDSANSEIAALTTTAINEINAIQGSVDDVTVTVNARTSLQILTPHFLNVII